MAQNEAVSKQSSEKNKWRYVKFGARRMTNITSGELVGFLRYILYISEESEGYVAFILI
jgi:hypothetical protein